MAQRLLLPGAVVLVVLVGCLTFVMLMKSPAAAPTAPSSPPAMPAELPKGTLVVSRETKGVGFLAAAWSPDGKTVAAAGSGVKGRGGSSSDTYIAILDPRTLEETARLEGHTDIVADLAFVGNGSLLVSASYDNTFRAWDVATRKELASLPIDHTGAYQMMAVSPDRQFVATVVAGKNRAQVQVWDVAKGELLPPVWVQKSLHRSIAVSNGGTMVAVGNEISTAGSNEKACVRIYQTAISTSRLLQSTTVTKPDTPISMSCMKFSADSDRLYVGRHSGEVEVWNVRTGRIDATWQDHTAGVNALAISPDGRFAVTAGGSDRGKGYEDCDLRIWRTADGELLGTIPGPTRPVQQVTWDPTGKLVTFGARDERLRTWDVSAMMK